VSWGSWGRAAFLLVAAPWFIAVSLKNPAFPQFFFIHEHFARYLTNEADRVEPWWYFVPLVFLALLPWLGTVWSERRELLDLARRRATDDQAIDYQRTVRLFLLIWCTFALLFFSVSRSKLATYILPIVPPLGVLLAPHIARRASALSQAAWITSALLVLAAAALCLGAFRKLGTVPFSMLLWASIAACAAIVAVSLARSSWASVALGSILGFQALMMAYSNLPPVRTSKQLVAAALPAIGADTPLFSVNQYRQSVAPYLQRTSRMVMYRGELAFGLDQENAGFIPTLEGFIDQWTSLRDAVAFVDPATFDLMRSRGVPMRIVSRDGRSVVISRK